MTLKTLAAALIASSLSFAATAQAQTAPAGKPKSVTEAKDQIRLVKVTPTYWRVTFHNPPFNIYGPNTMPQLNKVVTEIESDPTVRVVVFLSDVPDFFLTHYDFVPPLTDTTSQPAGKTGLPPLPDMLVRLSKAPVVSIGTAGIGAPVGSPAPGAA